MFGALEILMFLVCEAEAKVSTYISYLPPDLNSPTTETTLGPTSLFPCLQECMKQSCFKTKYDDVRK